ncbi:MAG: type VI secretion system tube protein TssD [Ferruginibacter sp.]
MSFLAKLEMNGKEYNVLNVEYDISQRMDERFRPNDIPKSGLIQLTIEASSDNNLIDWALNHSMLKEGKIIFYRRDASSKMRSIEFKDAFCVYLKETFTSDGKNPMVTRMTISPRVLTISSSKPIIKAWAGMGGASDEKKENSNEEISTWKPGGEDT